MPVCSSYARFRFPAEIISPAVWLYVRFPRCQRDVAEALTARGIVVSHDKVRQWRIASPEMLPTVDLLPHLICSPPVFAGGGGYGTDQHDDA